MGKKVGVILSGCGVYDGAEIHETVVILLALDRHGAEAVMCAPDIPQMHVVNHLTGEVEEGAGRNVLVESARIARGAVRDVATVDAGELDALILPGGFGAAKNLCDFAVSGADCAVDPGVSWCLTFLNTLLSLIAAVCIAPALIARVLGDEGPELTIGNDADTAGALQTMGAAHIDCPVNEFVIDRDRKLVSSPAYMLASSISEAAEGIERTVEALLDLV